MQPIHKPIVESVALTNAFPFETAVVLGGSGAVGALFTRSLTASGVKRVVSLDRSYATHDPDGAGERLNADVTALDDNASRVLESADLVVLAVPYDVAVQCVADLSARLKPGALLVDTLSVKSEYVPIVSRLSAPIEFLSINPMFGPDLGFAGRGVAVVRVSTGSRAREFESLLESWGSAVVHLTAEDHDRATAAMQAATHATLLGYALALKAMNCDPSSVASIAPPPHRALLALVARIVAADPEVYREIQVQNPYAREARAEVEQGLRRLEDTLASGGEEFSDCIDAIRGMLGSDRETLAEICGDLFRRIK